MNVRGVLCFSQLSSASALLGSSGGLANFEDVFLQGLWLADVRCRGGSESCGTRAGLQPALGEPHGSTLHQASS